MLFFGSALGRWVDRAPSRLRVLLLTIIINRIGILVSCIIWFAILSFGHPGPKRVFFAVALILGMVEKLSRGANILSMERDWVPTLANMSADGNHPVPYDLTHLNTTMRRIDMLCKLIAPLAVSTFVSATESEKIAMMALAAISSLSLGPECWGVLQVWNQNSRLRALKARIDHTAITHDQPQPMMPLHYKKMLSSARLALDLIRKATLHLVDSIRAYVADLGYYFSTAVWIPSLCAAVPHASVLTFSGTMLTYLLNAGFSLNIITAARASGAVFEIGSTFLFPWAVRTLSSPKHAPFRYNMRDYREVEQREPSSSMSDTSLGDAEDDNHAPCSQQIGPMIEHSIVKVGRWALGGLLLSLVSRKRQQLPPLFSHIFSDHQTPTHQRLQIPAVLSVFFLENADLPTTTKTQTSTDSNIVNHQSPSSPYPLAVTVVLILSISSSLLFRWTYDLCATQLTQTLVPATKRSSFGGTEMSIVSLVSLAHWIAAAIWHAQKDFQWLALSSFAAVAVGVGAYHWWWWVFGWKEKEGGSAS